MIEGGDGGNIVRVSVTRAHYVTLECTANGQDRAAHLLVGERDVGVPIRDGEVPSKPWVT